MLNLSNLNSINLDNEVVINGYKVANLSDTDATKLISILNGMTNSNSSSTVSTTVTVPTQKSKTSENTEDEFPSLGKPDETVGFITRYGKCVRWWESGIFLKKDTRSKVYYAIKQTIVEMGGKWNEQKKAYEFASKEKVNAFMKAQKERSTK